jgi:hypothetical protein
MTTTSRPVARSEFRARATAFGLAVLVTSALLASIGGVADQQFESVLLARATDASSQVATAPAMARKPRG